MVWFINIIANGLLRLVGVKVRSRPADKLSTEEFKTLVMEAGALMPESHQDMLLAILDLENITVEDVIYSHPAVLACAVVATPDPKWGETPCAFVELKEGAVVTEAEMIAHCRSALAGFKTPRKVMFGPLPKTSTGKIQKFVLRDQAKSAAAIE